MYRDAMTALPPFSLADSSGSPLAFPTTRHALLCFVKQDCPTCILTLPLIEAAHRAFGSAIDVLVIAQDDAPTRATLIEANGLTVSVLDDAALATSFSYNLDTVPTIILADGIGNELRQFVGFGKTDWRELMGELATISAGRLPEIDWSTYPEMRPGCGSKSVEPGIAERLAAESSGSPLRARRIEIAESDDAFEFMFDQGLTDGLPVVPPTPERVLRMLTGTKRGAQEVVAVVPPNMAPATVEKVAVNAVMAGCKPEYLPVVIASVEALCTEEFNAHGVGATTWGASPVVVVNGPIRQRLGINMGQGALGPSQGAALGEVDQEQGPARHLEINQLHIGPKRRADVAADVGFQLVVTLAPGDAAQVLPLRGRPGGLA